MTTKKDSDTAADAMHLPAETPREEKALETAAEKGKDYGDWKYKPWNGIDHWINEKTGASTFNLKDVR